jgi:hypothetical protein
VEVVVEAALAEETTKFCSTNDEAKDEDEEENKDSKSDRTTKTRRTTEGLESKRK